MQPFCKQPPALRGQATEHWVSIVLPHPAAAVLFSHEAVNIEDAAITIKLAGIASLSLPTERSRSPLHRQSNMSCMEEKFKRGQSVSWSDDHRKR
jgi:hypothetical protein